MKSAPNESFFDLNDTPADLISVIDVLRGIPYGRFQKILTMIFLVSFLATSTISFNFAFYLMP